MTKPEEIAHIIFNSPEAELNDLLCFILANGNFDIDQLFIEISLSANRSFPMHLRSALSTNAERRVYLYERIKVDLTYYASATRLFSTLAV